MLLFQRPAACARPPGHRDSRKNDMTETTQLLLTPVAGFRANDQYWDVTQYLLIPGFGLSSLGGINEALDVTAEFLIQAWDGSSS
jgi:hypothetical protein